MSYVDNDNIVFANCSLFFVGSKMGGIMIKLLFNSLTTNRFVCVCMCATMCNYFLDGD